jgi:predicted molibdopterin-dependent oxidoreductase YjgC
MTEPDQARAFVEVTLNGVLMRVPEGRTIAAWLLDLGIKSFRRTDRYQAPRGLFCGMGVCFDCIVEVDGETVRACLEPVRAGMNLTIPDDGKGADRAGQR